MKRFLKKLAVVSVVLFAGLYYRSAKVPKPRATVPVTRYHGYMLNHKAIDRAKGFTVLISNEGFGGVGRGTGILIDSTHVLTCAHMLSGGRDDLWIYPYPVGTVVKGKPVMVAESLDLALLELSSQVMIENYATFQGDHYDGEPITIIGNTLGSMHWFVSFGIISGSVDHFLLTDGVLYGGNSGGPWINEKGEVVALTDWTLALPGGQESGIHGGVSAATIKDFLTVWQSPMTRLLRLLGGAR